MCYKHKQNKVIYRRDTTSLPCLVKVVGLQLKVSQYYVSVFV